MPTNHANGSATTTSSRISAADPRTDQRVVAALEHYLELSAAGQAPELETFLAQYPEIAAELRDCLSGLELVRQAAPDVADSTAHLAQFALGLAPFSEPLGDFRILREIGRGGMGIVYEAEQLSLGRRVALKVLPFAGVLDERQLQRFKHEASAAAMLKHPHIVSIYSIGCERGVHFYAMELIDGPTLAELIEARKSQQPQERSQKPEARIQAEKPTASVQNPDVDDETSQRKTENRKLKTNPSAPPPFITHHSSFITSPATSPVLQAALSTVNSISEKERFRRIAELGIQAAEALEHAHERGIVHRDIKPSNLMIDAGGQLWITDFGLAHIEANPNLTLTGDLVGTLRYMSAEQAAGRPTMIDHRTDIYSLGATMYELATDRPVVQAQDRAAILREIAEKDPASPRKHTPSMPADLETILLKCLAKEPSTRYDSAKALAEDLRRFLEQKPVVAKRPSWLDRTGKWSRRHRALLSVSAVALLLTTIAATTAAIVSWRSYTAAQQALNERTEALKEANENLDLAGIAIERMLGRTGTAVWEQGNLDESRTLLAEAVTLLDRLLLRSGDPVLRERTARAQLQISHTYLTLNSLDDASKSIDRGLSIVRGLYDEFPRDESYRALLAAALNDKGSLSFQYDDVDTAESCFTEAVALGEASFDTRRSDPARIVTLQNALDGLAGVRDVQDRFEDAMELYDQIDSLYERMPVEFREHPEQLSSRAVSIHNQAMLVRNAGDFDEALALTERAIALQQQALSGESQHPRRRANYWNHQWLKTQILARQGSSEEAARLARSFLQEFADQPDIRMSVASLLLSVAENDGPDAEALVNEAESLIREQLKLNPVPPVMANQMIDQLMKELPKRLRRKELARAIERTISADDDRLEGPERTLSTSESR